MVPPSYPIVRLKPKSDARAIRHGFPWVYSDDLVLDRRTRALAPGSLAILEDTDRQPLGLVAVNSSSRIAARMLDTDPVARIDADWLRHCLDRALQHRARLFDAPYYRLVHAEADGLPGVIIDRYGDAAVIQPNAAWAEVLLQPLVDALSDLTDVRTIVKNSNSRARASEGLDSDGAVLRGAIEGPVEVAMNGAIYLADLSGGQKTGLFYDQRPNHAFAQRLASGARVLDVFSHVGGFGLAALAAGAQSALAVDGSAAALDLAQAGAQRMGQGEKLAIRRGDAFDVLADLDRAGERFDLVICDPPAFAPNRQALGAGLRAYERLARLAAPLVSADGYLVLCSCSHAAELGKFRNACARGVGRAGRSAQIVHTGFAGPDHPQLPQLDETAYLKALFFRLGA